MNKTMKGQDFVNQFGPALGIEFANVQRGDGSIDVELLTTFNRRFEAILQGSIEDFLAWRNLKPIACHPKNSSKKQID